ncbi:50S ribosomal protein L5 [Candidatus Kaiserbacteria bacterium RIFCSPHIGHO2_02_FULL_50_50]|uniref:Large ribosomal subunit protein uL5 n=1 Tax=Candidatus Kaiserbacteria bacterium RIFCSPHIGHO2_02_FULL_50_50 TaxID=1798492 RepID=A0A1F6DDF9_9BACT|nr:MAG: 50S ribosomal protein L5 [Candidatus Kaiserbacteria bacterium RIFCSPHIGHO2_02_FULL_50_50]OGG88186.1 MAG: 50S ribosomal protein L5 [Candidatus Kaiserbacteria bacterium RIFCSPLOWO2_12_FULL_50_10]
MMKETLASTFDALKGQFGYTSKMQAPRITKVVVSMGVGKISDKARLTFIRGRLANITGQKVADRKAKKSVASFKVREGDLSGFQATLRGDRKNDFLDKLVHVAFPSTRDFRGLKTSSVDAMGNYSIGIPEHTIFPECQDDEIKDIFPFAITIVTTAKTKEETLALLRHIGMPLQKEVA